MTAALAEGSKLLLNTNAIPSRCGRWERGCSLPGMSATTALVLFHFLLDLEKKFL